MKKDILLLSMIAFSSLSFAQIGVNTSNPQGAFHIDGNKDNALTGTPTTAQQSNDFVVLKNGNVGIGTTNPLAKFEIVADDQGEGTVNDFAFRGFGTSKLPAIYFTGANGTSSAPTNLVKDDPIGAVTFIPRVSNNYIYTSGSRITSYYQGNGSNISTDLRFATSGNERMRIAETGNVGIGTQAPVSALQVIGNEMRVGGPSSQTGSIANPVLRIHSNANADGSGGSLLFSENAESFGYYIRQNTEAGNTYGYDGLAIGASQAGKYAYNPAKPGVFVSDNQNISFGTATPQAMFHIDGGRDNNINSAPTAAQQVNDVVVNTSGNMGIGTLSPAAHLHVLGSGNGIISERNAVSNSNPAYLMLRKNNSNSQNTNGAVASGDYLGAITFAGNNGSGYNSSPLSSSAAIAAVASENFTTTRLGSELRFATVPNGATQNIMRMIINNDGKVGIGRIAATNILEVGGDASKNTAGSWLGNSDARLKKDIHQISSDEALEKLLKLKGVYYYWNDDKTGISRPKTQQIGFIAQNIQEVFPDKVSTDAKGYLQTAYGDYDAVVVEAIRALTQKIEKLEKDNIELKEKIKNLSN